MLDKYLAFVTMKRFQRILILCQPLVYLGLRFALRLVIVVSVGFALVVGRERRGFGWLQCFESCAKLCGASASLSALKFISLFDKVVQAVFHRCHSSCQTLKDRGAWTLLDSNSRCPHSAAPHNIERWEEGSSIGQQSGWNVIHDRCSSTFNVFVFGFERRSRRVVRKMPVSGPCIDSRPRIDSPVTW